MVRFGALTQAVFAVLDFRRSGNVPNYLGAPKQRQLLLLIGISALVAILALRSDDVQIAWRTWIAPRDPGQPLPGAPAQAGNAVGQGDRHAFFPGVRQDYLAEVKDDTVFRADESNAWFHLLALLEKADPRDLEQNS